MKTIAARELTRRGLWGYLPRQIAPTPEGPPTLALSFDLDYQADTDALPRLVDLADDVGVAMTLFAIGKLVETDPQPYADAAEAGHELANHTWSHPDNPVLNPDREFWDLDVEEMADEIGRCQDVIESVVGSRPTGFRTPHFKDAARMTEAIARFPELTYVSTTLASRCSRPSPYFPGDDRYGEFALFHPAAAPAETSPLMIPLTPCPGLRWSPFCSYSSIRRPTNRSAGAGLHTVPRWESLWEKMLARAAKRRFASVYFDPLDVMRDDETRSAFERMLRHAVAEGWEVTTLRDVENKWRPVAAVAA